MTAHKTSPVLELKDLRKEFVHRGLLRASKRLVAVKNLSVSFRPGEAVALVGESGSGKSTVARLMLRLIQPDRGRILVGDTDVLKTEPRRASMAYRRRVQMTFQDPFGSLNPVHDVAHHLIRPLRRHGLADAKTARAKAVELLKTVGLDPPEEFLDRHPYELSGGQRQRVAIARALAVDPALLVADEPTSMLDVSIRMDVLNLLNRLKKERGLSILLITHDLASARFLAERVLVLFKGGVVERGPMEEVIRDPAHPYTRALLSSIAGADRETLNSESRAAATEEAPFPGNGCPFLSRCPEAMDVCRTLDPDPRPHGDRWVACHLYPEEQGAAS